MELSRNQNGGINMLYKYFTEKLTGLQGLSIEKVEENHNTIHIHCKLERKKTQMSLLWQTDKHNTRLS